MKSIINYKNDLKNVLKKSKHFFVISHFNGNLNWIKYINPSNYLIYNKGENILNPNLNNIRVKNVGYNIYSYLKFIIDNYNDLPDTVVFCKDNIFPRHIKINNFLNLIKKSTFTCLEDNNPKRNFPISIQFSDNSFNEINSSWYKFEYSRKYFANYDDFYKYIFKNDFSPIFLRYAPGANYIVPKNNILSREKSFYKNLLKFVSHSQYSCESHFTERSLYIIWNSNIEIKKEMNRILNNKDLYDLEKKCNRNKQRESRLFEKFTQKIIFFIGNIYFKNLIKILKK